VTEKRSNIKMRRQNTHTRKSKDLRKKKKTCPGTVKPVYSDHARSWTRLVVMDRWSLYTGKLYRENARGFDENKWSLVQVIAIYRWSLRQV
jgi:hypothetical protein